MNTKIQFDLGGISLPVRVPDSADILAMGKAEALNDPESAIRGSLETPISSPPLSEIVKNRLHVNSEARAVIVISDNTRPVPYSGKEGILWPIVHELKKSGLPSRRITVLVATGTHHAVTDTGLRKMLDPRIFTNGISIINHDCRRNKGLVSIGSRKRLGDIRVNRFYMESDIKILTGLVESHFMAGVSGGRKAICPGLISEKSTQLIHGGTILSSPKARDLVLEGNPVHDEAIEVARMAGCDFIVNVTLNADYKVSGVFAGDMEKAHLKAVERLQNYVAIPVNKKYDLVISHAGFVGINHYQAAKAGTICASILREGGMCIMAARHTDSDPVGTETYKKMLRLLNEKGPESYEILIKAPDWTFVPDQWEPQMWARLFRVIPPENLIYCSKEIPEEYFAWIPGTNGRSLATGKSDLQKIVEESIAWALIKLRTDLGREPAVAVLKDGPYGIPVYNLSQNI